MNGRERSLEGVVTKHQLILPQNFDEYAWEVESKGWFSGARIRFEGKDYILTFYDAVRLVQEIEAEFLRGGVFFEPNLVVVKSLTRQNMEAAIDFLIRSGGVKSLVAG